MPRESGLPGQDDDVFYPESEPTECPQCGKERAPQYSSTFHCDQCRHKRKDIRHWREDSGDSMVLAGDWRVPWDEGWGLWVDPLKLEYLRAR
jgi:hypothetical protein